MTTKNYPSEAMAAIHEMAEGLLDTGAIDKKTMREFDDICLTPVRALTPEEIRFIREREHVSQSVFAHYLNVSKGVISQWERGEKHPAGASLKLLSLVEKNGLSAIA
jgi:putative transcriptional regulator